MIPAGLRLAVLSVLMAGCHPNGTGSEELGPVQVTTERVAVGQGRGVSVWVPAAPGVALIAAIGGGEVRVDRLEVVGEGGPGRTLFDRQGWLALAPQEWAVSRAAFVGGQTPLQVLATVTVPADVQSDLEVWSFERAGTGERLRMDLWMVAGDVDPGLLDEALEQVEAWWSGRGVSVVGLERHDVEAPARLVDLVRDADSGDLEDLAELKALAARERGPGLDVFLVNSIDGALGISGELPGPAVLHGHPASGIVIAAGIVGSPQLLAWQILHESAHYAGLFHTTEADGRQLDPRSGSPRS